MDFCMFLNPDSVQCDGGWDKGLDREPGEGVPAKKVLKLVWERWLEFA